MSEADEGGWKTAGKKRNLYLPRRAGRLEEDGDADDGQLAEALDELKVECAQLVPEDELLHIVGQAAAQLLLLLHQLLDACLKGLGQSRG